MQWSVASVRGKQPQLLGNGGTSCLMFKLLNEAFVIWLRAFVWACCWLGVLCPGPCAGWVLRCESEIRDRGEAAMRKKQK